MESHRRLAALAALFDAKCYWLQSEDAIGKLEGEEMQQQVRIIEFDAGKHTWKEHRPDDWKEIGNGRTIMVS